MLKKIEGYKIFMNKLLGSGSYGKVYLGSQQKTDLPVAVKIISKTSINSDPYLKAALFSEIKIMKTLSSPHIVQLYDVLESSNNYYIVEQLCDEDLEHYLKKNDNRLSQKQAIKILTEICTGFLPLIKEGILHRFFSSNFRDLKPANIFMAKGIAKIGDFGFAKKNTGGLKKHTSVGTPLYSSVEVLKAEPYTSKCDIWAMTFIFYEMLHGRTPWTANSEYELINNIMIKPLKLNENLDKNTKDFLQKGLGTLEEKRISWEEVFTHPIFGNYFQNEVKSNQHMENKYKKVMTDIRFQVNSQNIDLKKFWSDFGYDQKKELNQEQFRKFLKCVVPKLEKSEENYFFSKMDMNKDGNVSLKELSDEFQKHGICLTAKFADRIPFLLRQIVSIEEDNPFENNPNFDIQLQNKVGNCFKRLEISLKKKNLTLFKVFVAYDTDKSGHFSIEEFTKVMKRLDSTFTDEELELIFGLIDEDKSKTISFTELNSYYSKINGIPEALNIAPEANFFKK